MPITTLLAIVCLIGFLLMGTALAVKLYENGPLFVFYPPVLLVVFYLAFFLLPSVVVLFNPDGAIYRYSFNGYSDSTWILTELYGFVFVAIAALVAYNKVNVREFFERARAMATMLKYEYTTAMKVVYYFIFLVTPIVTLYYFITLFGGEYYKDYMMNRIMERRGMGFVLMPTMWLTLFVPALFISHAGGRARFTAILLSLVLIAFYTAAHLYLGSKSRGLMVLVYGVMAWIFLRAIMGRVNLQHYLLIVGLGFSLSIVGLFFGDIRESMTKGVFIENVETRVGWGQSFSKFNAFGAVENTAWLVENVPHKDVLMGQSFAAVLVGYVPRVWWENKPTGGGPALRNLIHPGSYDIVKGVQLSSYSPGIIAEAYMNFGIFGLLLIAPLLGYALGLLMRWISLVQTPLDLALWGAVHLRLTWILTVEVFGTMSGIFQMVVPVLLFRLLFTDYFRRPRLAVDHPGRRPPRGHAPSLTPA